MKKIIVRIKGGMGNQLFSYAAARRMAISNNVELVIDDVTGFIRDRKYRRFSQLENFKIPCRRATAAERLEPFERYRRGVLKFAARKKSFEKKRYLEQERIEFDARLLARKVDGILYLDGLWQSESYFKDVEPIIREDLQIKEPSDNLNKQIAETIRSTLSVALHARWFFPLGSSDIYNLSCDYYQRAISYMEEGLDSPHYFLFSDDPAATRKKLDLPTDRVTIISHNQGDENAYADLWLMSQCNHFIIANSTFSWWGAWLSSFEGKIILCPDFGNTQASSWGFEGLIPDEWILL
ncbi:alpha-1,2-fucosyltransferase [bacterium]|nr:alpha-1,2-fucosyltransferase [bacterium]